jgi:alanine dehydrogenase
MIVLNQQQTAAALPYKPLVEALRQAFTKGYTAPLRSMHKLDQPDGTTAVYGLMPGWAAGEVIGTKLVTVFPGNAAKGVPTVQAIIVLFDGATGTPVGIVDGTEATYRRTACASALAADYLARSDATRYLIVGTGPLGVHFAGAMASVRPIKEIRVWGRNKDKAEGAAAAMASNNPGILVTATDDLEAAAGWADIVSTVTSSPDPVIEGAWLRPGTHLDLVGAHTPTTRECDDDAITKARVFVDVRSAALAEAGELIIPIKAGKITESHVAGDLVDLALGKVAGRQSADQKTAFKSVGHALEDIAAAQLALGI